MKEKEFKELLEQIENNTFIGNKLRISGADYYEEGVKREEALTDDNIIELVRVLQKNPNITILDLPFNNIGDIGATALSSLKSIECLDLYGNNITVKGTTSLGRSNFKALTLADNAITYNYYGEDIDYDNPPYATDLEMQEMIDAFISNKTITFLGFNRCCFFGVYDILISQLISKNSTIKRLDLSYNSLSDKILKYISNNTTLEEIYIEENLMSFDRDITIHQLKEVFPLPENSDINLVEVLGENVDNY